MNILLAVDGSPCSERAVEYLIGYVAGFKETPAIHLLHVHQPIPIGRVQSHIGHATLESYYREESEVQLAAARARLEAAGIQYTPHIHVGQPAEVIAKLAKDLDCGQIVMGTHGHGAVASLVIGSVAAKVLHLASCPILLVK
ncbi:MAG: universal stress protein [Actinomycetota bacterium]